ncbi:hypothetical protein IHE44_0011828 [Lamprotornis superbus]|uniref:TIR domain-containing protein n=1 Tax=Lamprotornis superbus TaxID=245042 RepID=A0A835TMX0_9PASS|nr:hypothetical protein IHE44_0011828 [Lamprotornis superbus]
MMVSPGCVRMCTPLLVTLVTLVLVPAGVSPYGFRNCIQAPWDPGLFRCIQRFLSTVGAAVGDLPSTATSLNLSVNTLRQVPPRAFAHLPRLYTLDLSHNQLELLAPEAFCGLSSLAHLDLAHNNLSVLATGVFTPLGNLSTLRLDHNPLQKVAPGAFQSLEALSTLWLRGGQLSALEPVATAVRNLTHLDLLDLCANMVSTLAPGLPPTLRVLLLCNNSLGSLSGATPGVMPPGLRVLDLSYNNISDPAPLARLCLHNLTSLHLAGNPLDMVQLLRTAGVSPRHVDVSGLRMGIGDLEYLCQQLTGPPLQRLQLQRLKLKAMPNGSLAKCPELGALDVSGNQLRYLGCIGRLLNQAQRATLHELVAEHNLLQRLPSCKGTPVLHQLHNVSLRFNRILVAGAGAFDNAPALRQLRLDVNGLARLHRAALRGLRDLRHLRLDNNLLTDLLPGSFADLQQLEDLNLRNNRVAVLFPGAFKGLDHLKTLDLGGNNLRHLAPKAFQGLPQLCRLYLDRNRLLEVRAEAFQLVQVTLGVLDLRANALRYLSRHLQQPPPFRYLHNLYDLKLQAQQPYGMHVVPHRFFQGLSALRSLYLSQNSLSAIPADAFDDLAQLQYLTLADSNGGMGHLPAGIFKNLSQLRSLNLESAGLRSLGPEVFGNLTQLKELRLAKNELRALDVTLATCLPALHYLDLRKCPLSCSCANAWLPGWLARGPVQVVYLYNYTCEELVPELERGALRLCLHHRDFRPGRAIVDNIVDAVYNSRHTVCVVSRGYLRSEWCSLEIQMASYRLFDELRDVLVLIFLEDIPEAELSAFHRMRRVLLRRTHLRWPPEPPAQPLFWAKLRCALSGGEEEEEDRERGGREEGCPGTSEIPGEVLPQESNFPSQNHSLLYGEGALWSGDDGNNEEEKKEERKGRVQGGRLP